MAIGAQQTDFGSRAEANHYIRGAQQRGKSMKNASAQLTDSGLMAMLQRTVKLRVVAKHQITTCL